MIREETPFDASTPVLFCKRISAEMLMEVNENLLDHKDNHKDENTSPSGGKSSDDGTAQKDTNKGTLTLDATCASANICYPQDISFLNEAREKLEKSFADFVNVIVINCLENIANAPEKSIFRLPKAESIRQRKSAARSADSLPM